MYGIVNKAIEELVTDKFGAQVWNAVKMKSGIKVDFFLSNEAYDDEITYQLANAASSVLGIELKEVLNLFGEWWIMHTCKEKYGAMMNAGGSSLRAFILNLPRFHDRAFLMYPKLAPPEFKTIELDEHHIMLHYFSNREGLQEFVRGLLQGLAKFFDDPVTIELVESRLNNNHHEIFKISWV
jgi:hypothetical protein